MMKKKKIIMLLCLAMLAVCMLSAMCIMSHAGGADNPLAGINVSEVVDPNKAVLATAVTIVAGIGIFTVRNLGK